MVLRASGSGDKNAQLVGEIWLVREDMHILRNIWEAWIHENVEHVDFELIFAKT